MNNTTGSHNIHGETTIAPAAQGTEAVLEQIAYNYFNEQRRARKWSLFFRFVRWTVFIAVLIVLLVSAMLDSSDMGTVDEPHIAVIDIQGAIAPGGQVNAIGLNSLLQDAFQQEQTAAILLHINSPGGSPVQAALIYDEIMRQKAITDKPVYAVIDDIGASAAYYIAASADQIYANRHSIVGSIGVIFSSFGYQKLLEKVGLQSRTKIAGKYKDIGNPERPETPFEKRFLQHTIDTMHANFIEDVKRGRGDRLTGRASLLFSGLFWTAAEAKELGLIDQLAHFQQVQDEVGVETLVYYSNENRFEELLADIKGALMNQQQIGGVGVSIR